jgi:hypothetical protein
MGSSRWSLKQLGLIRVLALLAFVFLSAAPVPASAQNVCDPYTGCNTTTSTAPRQRPVIIIDVRVTVDGQVIRVRACGYLPGITLKVTINGIVVAQVVTTTNPPKDCSPSSFASAGRGSSAGPVLALVGPLGRALASSPHRISAQAAPNSAYGEASVTVPNLAPGDYLVCAEAPGFDTPCTSLKVVLAGSSGGGGPLAFTGFHIAELAAAGLAAIGVGRVLLRRNRRRSRRA